MDLMNPCGVFEIKGVALTRQSIHVIIQMQIEERAMCDFRVVLVTNSDIIGGVGHASARPIEDDIEVASLTTDRAKSASKRSDNQHLFFWLHRVLSRANQITKRVSFQWS